MPYVNLKVKGTLTRDQKEKLSLSFSEAIEKITGKPKAHTYVVIDEVSGENWAVGGDLLG